MRRSRCFVDEQGHNGIGKEINYAGNSLDTFEEQMRKHARSWAAFDIRMMFQGYLERGSWPRTMTLRY